MPNPYRHARKLTLLFCLMLLPLMSGCGSQKFYPVRGIVRFPGGLKEGEVRFRPNSAHDLIATGKIQKDGTFTLSTPGHGDAVLEGSCKAVVIVEPKKGKLVVDEKYANFDTSELNFTVQERDQNYFVLEIAPPGK